MSGKKIRVHWFYGEDPQFLLEQVKELCYYNPYVMMDYNSAKWRYQVTCSTSGHFYYNGEKTAIIHNVDTGKSEARIVRLLWLFNPYIMKLQKIDGIRWNVEDVYITSTHSPMDVYGILKRKPAKDVVEFLKMISDVNHIARVIELPV